MIKWSVNNPKYNRSTQNKQNISKYKKYIRDKSTDIRAKNIIKNT